MPSQLHLQSANFVGPIRNWQQWLDNKHKLRMSNFSQFFPPEGLIENYQTFLSEGGLLLNRDWSYDCPRCGPGQKLSPCRDKGSKFGFHLKCVAGPTHCGKKMQPTEETWFARAHVSLHQNLGLMMQFAMDIPVTHAAECFDVALETAVDMYSMLREACGIRLLNDLHQTKIGGPGRTVEIDESKVSKHKYHRGRKTARQNIWCFGGIERESRRSFGVLVRKRNRRTLFPLIERFIERGTTILSDKWRAYRTVDQLIGGQHVTINHSEHYVDPRHPTVHTNTIERRWSSMKELIKCFREGVLESHVQMTIFRNTYLVLDFNPDIPMNKRRMKNVGELLDVIFDTIRMVYPGVEQNAMVIPPRTQVPEGSHPFPGTHSMIIESESEDDISQRVIGTDSEDSSGDDGRNSDSDLDGVESSQEVPPSLPNQLADINPLSISVMEWEEIDIICQDILFEIANTEGVFHDRWLLQNSFAPHEAVVEAILLKVRLESRKRYLHSGHSKSLYSDLDNVLPNGIKEAMRPLATEAQGDCFFSTMSWSVQNAPQYTSTHRLLCLRVVIKYFANFDTLGMRLEIEEHHGSSGALSLALSLTASGTMGLDLYLRGRYQRFLKQSFNFASSCTILAASVVLKSRVIVYKELGTSGPIRSLKTAQQAFEVDNAQTTLAHQRRFPSSSWYRASPGYLTTHRVHHDHEHFVHLMPKRGLTDLMLLPFQRHPLHLPLTPVDV